MTRTAIPMMPSVQADRGGTSFPCFGFDVAELGYGTCEVYRQGEFQVACERRQVEHVCLMLLRVPK